MSPFKKNQNKKVFGQEDQRAKKKKKERKMRDQSFLVAWGPSI
jgi:hypothetical protein